MIVTDERLAEMAAELVVDAVRDLAHDRMGLAEQFDEELDGLSEAEREELLDRFEAAVRKHLPPDQQ